MLLWPWHAIKSQEENNKSMQQHAATTTLDSPKRDSLRDPQAPTATHAATRGHDCDHNRLLTTFLACHCEANAKPTPCPHCIKSVQIALLLLLVSRLCHPGASGKLTYILAKNVATSRAQPGTAAFPSCNNRSRSVLARLGNNHSCTGTSFPCLPFHGRVARASISSGSMAGSRRRKLPTPVVSFVAMQNHRRRPCGKPALHAEIDTYLML